MRENWCCIGSKAQRQPAGGWRQKNFPISPDRPENTPIISAFADAHTNCVALADAGIAQLVERNLAKVEVA
ncbi:MAG: hypothetical protein Q4A97_03085, partial [Comamonadaceae bacterium]|nr:hypothetical protein [Comamonadaceae bacterium]